VVGKRDDPLKAVAMALCGSRLRPIGLHAQERANFSLLNRSWGRLVIFTKRDREDRLANCS
jgi:hypothetical protein